jgi:hypothetical protein
MEDNKFLMWEMVNQKAMGLKGNILLAMEVYARKRGQEANLVEVNAEDLGDQVFECVGFEVKAVKTVLKGTLLVGRRENGTDKVH